MLALKAGPRAGIDPDPSDRAPKTRPAPNRIFFTIGFIRFPRGWLHLLCLAGSGTAADAMVASHPEGAQAPAARTSSIVRRKASRKQAAGTGSAGGDGVWEKG